MSVVLFGTDLVLVIYYLMVCRPSCLLGVDVCSRTYQECLWHDLSYERKKPFGIWTQSSSVPFNYIINPLVYTDSCVEILFLTV